MRMIFRVSFDYLMSCPEERGLVPAEEGLLMTGRFFPKNLGEVGEEFSLLLRKWGVEVQEVREVELVEEGSLRCSY